METSTKDMEQEVAKIQTEFHAYKRNTNQRLDEIIEKIKPQFSSAQITGFLLTLVSMMAGAMLYITDVKSDTRVNTIKSTSNEKDIDDLEKIQALQYQNIDVKLDQLIKDVAVLNAQKKPKQ